jgi:hypothetical protein
MNALAQLSDDYAAEKKWLLGLSVVNRHERRVQKAHLRRSKSPSSIDEARRTARVIGSLVWTAADEADFLDILDAQANDLPASQSARTVSATLYAGRFARIADPVTFMRAVCAKVPEESGLVTDLLAGLRIGAVISGLFGRHARSAPDPKATGAAWEGFDLYALPIPLLNAVLAHAQGTACLAALVDLVLSDRPSPPRWLTEAVARGWVKGERSVVRMLAMMYGDAGVPEDLVPSDQRFRQEQIISDHNEGEALFEAYITETATIQ